MRSTYRPLIYGLSFFSGAAALLYEICWFRSLTLVIGGTQFAVTTIISVFMAGLALGSWLAARYLHRFRNLLSLYGALELGVALCALGFLFLMRVYPSVYIPLANLAPDSLLYRTVLRIILSTAAMIIPATLMGATLPVLTGWISADLRSMPGALSLLYGLNTLGAVFGAGITGFMLLPAMPVSAVMLVAAAINLTIGLIGLVLPAEIGGAVAASAPEQVGGASPAAVSAPPGVSRMILWGIGISGFCALGYEVLWTRILVLFLGATVYSFTLILVAFLLGIGLGSSAYGAYERTRRSRTIGDDGRPASAVMAFGVTQLLIGSVTFLIIQIALDIPAYSEIFRHALLKWTGRIFVSHQLGNLIIAFAILAVPAFLMGLSIPLAGRVYAGRKKAPGRTVGELLTYNTSGAIVGGALSGFVFLYYLGIERSLQVLCLINMCIGAAAVLATRRMWRPPVAAGIAFLGLAFVLFYDAGRFRHWDPGFLATYTPDRAALYRNDKLAQEEIDNHEVLYYAEGFDAIVSSTLRRDTGVLQFSVNGRPEASTNLEDVQNQYMLGHLPMLLHKAPKKALVVGAGSGMTLAAVFSHPEITELHLVEIEPHVLNVARAFGAYNHRIIDHPDLEIIYDDARNYLLATKERFDVITSDPIHPVWRGSGYLYTSEYFKLAAERLTPGGIMCQWLPLYLLSTENVRSIVETFRRQFPHMMVWLTMVDVQLIGSREPISVDADEIDRRIKAPAVFEDLREVFMGSAEELFSYFLLGSAGAAAFAGDAVVNTDDNVYLEFSSPETIGSGPGVARNVAAMIGFREDIASYLTLPQDSRSSGMDKKAAGLHALADRSQLLYLMPRKDPATMEGMRTELKQLQTSGRLKSLQVGLFGYEGSD